MERTERIEIRVSPEEKQRLEKNAAAENVRVADFIRQRTVYTAYAVVQTCDADPSDVPEPHPGDDPVVPARTFSSPAQLAQARRKQ